jgi:hypothetical protein
MKTLHVTILCQIEVASEEDVDGFVRKMLSNISPFAKKGTEGTAYVTDEPSDVHVLEPSAIRH